MPETKRDELIKELHNSWCFENVADLILARERSMREENKELLDFLTWWDKLVERSCIGTAKTPSLRAYIEQIEQENIHLKDTMGKVREVLSECSKLIDEGYISSISKPDIAVFKALALLNEAEGK